MKKYCNESLANHTTFKIGGECDFFYIPQNIDDIKKILKFADGTPLYVIGNGSNLLVRDDHINGIVIKIGDSTSGSNFLNNIEIDGEVVKAEAGINLGVLCSCLADKGLSGLEFAAGIPGTLGGAIYMNAGSNQESIGTLVEKVEIMKRNAGLPSGEIKWYLKEEMRFGYRQSSFSAKGGSASGGKSGIILSTVLKLQKKNPKTIKEKMEKVLERRRTALPLDFPSAGSIFKNPIGDFAARLIETCNLKGLKSGDAIVSEKHANFILNTGNATYKDVYSLITTMRGAVKKKFGISLELEVTIW